MSLLSSRLGLLKGVVFGLLLLLASGPVHAQSNGNGSIYSRFGLGTLQDFSSSQSDALGGGGYALRSLNYNPMANPALWSDQVFTRLSAGASYQNVTAKNSRGQSSRLTSGNVEALQFSFPLYERTLGVGLSFQPYSTHNYRTQKTDSLRIRVGPGDTEPASAPYEVNFQGGGGLHSIRGGLGYKVNDLLRVGASVDFIFGLVEHVRSTNFSQRQNTTNVTVTDATRFFGVSGTFGGHLALSDVLLDDDALSLGASVVLPTTLNGTRVLTLAENRSLTPDTLSSPSGQSSFDGEVSLPLRSRFGLAYQPNAKWTVTADGLYEPWSSFSSTFSDQPPFSRQFPVGGDDTLTDRWRVSVGAEIVPAGGEQFSGFLANTGYRLGAYTERMYVRPDEQTDLQTYAVTGGFSFPTSLSGTRIDLNLSAGTRGTTEDAFVQDTFYGVALHVNFGERWFQEPKLR